jgi:hypothetical protein
VLGRGIAHSHADGIGASLNCPEVGHTGRASRTRSRPTHSRQNPLPSTYLHHETQLIVAIGRQYSHAYRADTDRDQTNAEPCLGVSARWKSCHVTNPSGAGVRHTPTPRTNTSDALKGLRSRR